MAKDYLKYLDPETVSRLSNLGMIARLVVEGFITGLHKSPYHGFSVEFAEHRQYMPGDDLKYLDWKVYAKTDRFYVKEFEEETNLKSYILLDQSASMDYTSHTISKRQYATFLGAALSYLMLKQRDAVGLLTFDEKIRGFYPPRSMSTYLSVLLKALDESSSGKRTDLGQTFHELAERINRRGLVIVLSDLLDNQDKVLSGLKHFRHKKHEVIVFHILDPFERSFDFNTASNFEDLESGEKMSVQPWHIRASYRDLMHEFIERYKRECREYRIDYVLMDTQQSFDRALVNYLAKRKKIGG